MTIEVYTYTEQQERALLDFLKSEHYDYKSTKGNESDNADFINQYNKDLDDAEAQIDNGQYVAHEEVKKYFAEKKKSSGGN